MRRTVVAAVAGLASGIALGADAPRLSTAPTPVVAQPAEGRYRIFQPDGPAPHPAVVFLPGCSGFGPENSRSRKGYEHHAEQLRRLGFVVVWADYLGRRNLTNCAGGGITQDEAGRDAVAAASWLRSQPYVDAKRITAMGWSYGGGAVLAALGNHGANQLIFTRAIVYYPYCDGVGPWTNRIPVLVLRGISDTVAPPRLCASALDAGSGTANVKIIDYPEALHAFDNPELPPRIESPLGILGYHPQAASAAWDEVKRFLQSGT